MSLANEPDVTGIFCQVIFPCGRPASMSRIFAKATLMSSRDRSKVRVASPIIRLPRFAVKLVSPPTIVPVHVALPNAGVVPVASPSEYAPLKTVPLKSSRTPLTREFTSTAKALYSSHPPRFLKSVATPASSFLPRTSAILMLPILVKNRWSSVGSESSKSNKEISTSL